MKRVVLLPSLSGILLVVAFALCGSGHTEAQEALPPPLSDADFEGVPFVTEPAPTLNFEIKDAPRPQGIDYAFKEQTASGAAVFSRFPEFELRDRRIHVSGPWYDNDQANGHFSRGVTTIECMPNFRQGPTDVCNLPHTRKWMLLTDPFWWGYAERLADHLEEENPADSRIAALRTFGEGRRFSNDEDAYVSLGRYAWEQERFQGDTRGEGVLFPSVDIEGTEGWEHQRDCMGWLYRGMADAARDQGIQIVPVTYGQWTFCVGAVHFSTTDKATGYPEYLLPEHDFLAAPDPTLDICNRQGGVLSMDGYLQAIWGTEPFYKRGDDGRLVMQDGAPVFNDVASTTLYGREIMLEENEAAKCLEDFYRQAARMYLMHHRLAGEYPAHSGLRKPFLANTRVGAWSRITNEGLQGIEQNNRPLPGWLFEALIGMYLFTADDIVIWSSDTNHPPGPPGGDYSKYWKHNAHGVMEHLVKAAHRYSALDPIHEGPFQWCWFHLPMVDQNKTEGERYHEKPIVFGKIRTFRGRPWIELFAIWPALDNESASMKVWVQGEGLQSEAHTIELANGRTYFYDAWQLPEGLDGIQGSDVWLQFTDLAGTTRTWRGDWRLPTDGASVPPDFKAFE